MGLLRPPATCRGGRALGARLRFGRSEAGRRAFAATEIN